VSVSVVLQTALPGIESLVGGDIGSGGQMENNGQLWIGKHLTPEHQLSSCHRVCRSAPSGCWRPFLILQGGTPASWSSDYQYVKRVALVHIHGCVSAQDLWSVLPLLKRLRRDTHSKLSRKDTGSAR